MLVPFPRVTHGKQIVLVEIVCLSSRLKPNDNRLIPNNDDPSVENIPGQNSVYDV